MAKYKNFGLCLIVAAIMPISADAQSSIKVGYYSGRISCSDSLGSYKETIKLYIDKDGSLEEEIDFENYWQLVSSANGQNVYQGDPNFDLSFRGDDETSYNFGSQSITLSKSGQITLTRSGKSPIDGDYTGTCSGKLTRVTSRENLGMAGEYGRYDSGCITFKKRTPVFYSFNDSGGYFARFKLTASSCGGRAGLTLENYAKYTESATLTRVKAVPAGRWRFSVTTTDSFMVEGLPGYR